jgi:hypothetical protein
MSAAIICPPITREKTVAAPNFGIAIKDATRYNAAKIPPNHAHFGMELNAGMEPRLVALLAHTMASKMRVTETEIIVVRTGEPVDARKRAFQAICIVRPAPPSATMRNKMIRVHMI